MGIFKPDGAIYNIINKFTIFVVLSLCWLLCCIPIITIGSATSALFAVCFKLLKDEDSHIVKKYFSYFKSNFKQATFVWVIVMLCGCLLASSMYLYFSGILQLPEPADFLIVFVVFCSFIYIISAIYVFACTARYENTPLQTIKNSIFIGLRYIGRSLIIIMISISVIFMCMLNLKTLFIGILTAPALLCYVQSSFIMKIFEMLEK